MNKFAVVVVHRKGFEARFAFMVEGTSKFLELNGRMHWDNAVAFSQDFIIAEESSRLPAPLEGQHQLKLLEMIPGNFGFKLEAQDSAVVEDGLDELVLRKRPFVLGATRKP